MFGVVPEAAVGEAGARRRTQPDSRWRCGRCWCAASETLLIDAGIGDKMDAKSVDDLRASIAAALSIDSLADAGLAPSDIDIVLASHLHFDHAGGFTLRDGAGALVPAFPRARYVVRTAEWEDATHPHERNRASYLAENFVPLQRPACSICVPGDRRDHARRAGGADRRSHDAPPDRRSSSRTGATAVFAADLIPTTAHIDEPWIMGYDLYPMDTLTFKRAFIREAIDREYLIFFEHDPDVAAGYIRETRRPEVRRAGVRD